MPVLTSSVPVRGLGQLMSLYLIVVLPAPYPGAVAVSAVLGVMILLAAQTYHSMSLHVGAPALPILFLLVCAASIAWTPLPRLALKGIALPALTLIVLFVVRRKMEHDSFYRAFANAMRGTLLLSVTLGALLPRVGLDQGSYQHDALQGPFDHRNLMAYVAAVALITFLAEKQRIDSLIRSSSISLALVCLLLARSQTAWAVTVSTLIVLACLRFVQTRSARWRSGAFVTVGLSLLTLAIAAVANLDKIVVSIGRDPTLTGRTQIWDVVGKAVRERPYFGYGWKSVWNAGTEPTDYLWNHIGFSVFHAHDGYLEIALQLGVAGLIPVIWILAGAYWRGLRPQSMEGVEHYYWYMGLLVSLTLENVTESRFILPIGWLILVVLAMSPLSSGSKERSAHSQIG